MPRRFREYLDRLSRRNTHREEPNTFTVSTTVNLRDYAPWNATQFFPENEVPPTMVYHHDMDDPTAEVFPGRTVRPSEALRRMWEENMTVQDYEELASRRTASNDFAVPENMLRLVRLSMPNINRNELVEERPMDSPSEEWISRVTGIPASYFSADYNEPITYTPYWSNETVTYTPYWSDKLGGHVEYRRGKIIRVKRYCKI